MLGGHPRVSKSVDDGDVEAWWECRTQHIGRAKARTWVENTWTGEAGGEEGQAVRMKIEATALRSIVLRYAGAPIAIRVSFFFPFVYLEMSLFPSIFVPLPFSLYIERVRRTFFFFRMVFFYLVTTGWIFYISLLCENSKNSKYMISRSYTAFHAFKKNLTPI